MQTKLADWARNADYGKDVEAIIGRCTHCGFCLATCPTFQILGDELDSPRGRIYQMKAVFEGAEPSHATQQHLDRCLTCRNCETTCPSGVEYGKLVDAGRRVLDQRVRRPLRERLLRAGLRRLMGSRGFGPLYRLGRFVRPVLPAALKSKIPRARAAGAVPQHPERHTRQVLLLANCVQPAMLPSIDAATRRVLDAVGIGTRVVAGSGCCGAINFHLDVQDAARRQMRANVDAWLPLLESGAAEAVVVNASGCGAFIKDYAQHLRHDPQYAERAARLMPYVKDVAELLAPLADELRARMRRVPGRTAFHAPCTLQHWQGLRGTTERLLQELGFDLQAFAEPHLCCGSAGTYSITQPELSRSLRDRKLAAIEATHPEAIVSANIGCICHLQGGTSTPVKHWVECVDEAMHGPARDDR
ncbi:MAG: glycolate oxidase iron-sulfur subunit [Rhodanobacteraceae bacterium]|nr:MAG: glycolate oxidase iron-sulfur subunit [Rhodanobacteraceae bacterium]